ncbi:nucleotidyltransferase domain-containing protein, partial [Aeromonas caviae]
MKALVLFGSTARHEADFNSDIDLLGVYDGDKIKSICIGTVSLFLYPERTLIEK